MGRSCRPSGEQRSSPRPRIDGAGSLSHTDRVQKLSLTALARVQLEQAHAAGSGRSAKTVWGGHERVMRQTLIALTAGSELAEHENPGEATIQVLTGRVRLDADGHQWEGRQGDLLLVPPNRHALHALADSVILLSVAKLDRG